MPTGAVSPATTTSTRNRASGVSYVHCDPTESCPGSCAAPDVATNSARTNPYGFMGV